jgi:4-hydroxybenzoate polyprenyltransferase
VLPILPGRKRLRDLGWGKIILIGWSWAWLTAFIPLFYFTASSIQIAVIHTLERMLFIILITIPFEIRDITVDKSVGLMTLPERFGRKKTMRISIFLGAFIAFLSLITGFHYFNPAYVVAMSFTCALTIPLIYFSYGIEDDYYFGGIIDGLMILVLWVFAGVNIFL